MWNSTVVTFFEMWYRWKPSRVPIASTRAKHVAAQIELKNLESASSYYIVLNIRLRPLTRVGSNRQRWSRCIRPCSWARRRWINRKNDGFSRQHNCLPKGNGDPNSRPLVPSSKCICCTPCNGACEAAWYSGTWSNRTPIGCFELYRYIDCFITKSRPPPQPTRTALATSFFSFLSGVPGASWFLP